jgi:hypothetical protein
MRGFCARFRMGKGFPVARVSRPFGKPSPALFLLILSILAGCSLLFPPQFERLSLLIPEEGQGVDQFSIEDGVLSYENEGVRIDVEYMSDRELNELFPKESTQGRFSTNPYTYGDYVDPAVGHVRNRLTVFRVTVHNLSLAKVELKPLRCLLTTDREGERLAAYGIQAGSADRSLESYYKALQGESGNEYYRFNMRMGIVRANSYFSDEKIFRGESYGGFIAFDPLDDEVEEVILHIRDFALKFNAFDKPLQNLDASFRFRRELSLKAYEDREVRASEQAVTRAVLSAPSQVIGAVTGAVSRDGNAIDAFIRTRLDEINACFEREFIAGNASVGEVAVRLVLLSHGGIERAEVVSSSVGGEKVDECILSRIERWRFRPSGGGMQEAAVAGEDSLAAGVRPPPISSTRVIVTSSIAFEEMEH